MKIRVPFDENYVSQIGKAIYLFSYYEWTIIYLVEQLQPGFVKKYSREKTMTSNDILKKFKSALELASNDFDGNKAELKDCSNEFARLIPKRNALVHAHPHHRYRWSSDSQLSRQTLETYFRLEVG